MTVWEYAQVEVTGPHVRWKARGLVASLTASWTPVRPDGDPHERETWKITFQDSRGSRPLPERPSISAVELLNHLGQRRWELVHVSSGTRDGQTRPATTVTRYVYTLKRPVPPDPRRSTP
jgi:hypothetical protein